MRYCSYIYLRETGLYYLQSRYYNPTWGRFLNADDLAYLGANADLISFNLYAYCSNNPVHHSDPTGHFIIAIPALIKVVIGIVAVAATINDIYQIASGNVSVDSTSSIEDGDFQDNVRISDSYKILTPWMQYGYNFYLNHINDDTKNIIDGTTIGVTHEWMLHNIAYAGASILGLDTYRDAARSVDVGKTLFDDDHGNIIEHSMKISYIVINPMNAVIDFLINGGYG